MIRKCKLEEHIQECNAKIVGFAKVVGGYVVVISASNSNQIEEAVKSVLKYFSEILNKDPEMEQQNELKISHSSNQIYNACIFLDEKNYRFF